MFASFAQQGSVEAIRRGGFVARLIPAMALALAVAGSTSARAGLVMSIQDVSGPSGGAGSFEVLLSNTGGTSFDVASFSLELKIEGGSFESVSTATTVASYIFDGTGGASVDPGFQFSLDNFPNTTFTASDSEWTSPSIAVGPGDIFGLGFVTYSYSAGAAPDLVRADGNDAFRPRRRGDPLHHRRRPPGYSRAVGLGAGLRRLADGRVGPRDEASARRGLNPAAALG